MSVQHFTTRWATLDVFNACWESYKSDIGVLSLGQTFVGYRYRDQNNRINVVVSKHLKRSWINMLKTLDGVNVIVRNSHDIAVLCRTYRKWSFSIKQDAMGEAYRLEYESLREYLETLQKQGLPMPKCWHGNALGLKADFMHYSNCINKTMVDDQFDKIRRSHVEMSVYQLIRIGLVDSTAYAVAYKQRERYRWSLLLWLEIVDTVTSREQMVALQLATPNMDELRFLVL